MAGGAMGTITATANNMVIEIIKVEVTDYESILTNEKWMNEYRRHAADHWEHKLGVHGWHRVIDPELLEDAYQRWKRKNVATTKTSDQ